MPNYIHIDHASIMSIYLGSSVDLKISMNNNVAYQVRCMREGVTVRG